jgi:signal transduction histidine kinase
MKVHDTIYLAMRACLAILLVGVSLLTGMASAIEITSAERQDLSEKLAWCASSPGMDIAEVVTGKCDFRQTGRADLARGFSADTFWLRVELNNPGTSEIQRWLQVGHPRLERVSLFEVDKSSTWHRTDTGIRVPVSQRPIIATYPLLPLVMSAGESRTVYVRVESRTSIELTSMLWVPNAYISAHQGTGFFQAILIGGLVTAALFTLMVYFKWRDRVYLYFGASLLCEVIFDTCYAGFLPLYLWPKDWPFDIRIQTLAIGGMAIFFVLFVRKFIGNMQRYRYYNVVLITLSVILVLAILWACLVNYGEAVRMMILSILAVLLSGVALLFSVWRKGSKPAGYLLVSYTMLFLMLIGPVIIAFGGSNFLYSQSIIYSWRFLIITPIILAGIAQRSEELRDVQRQVTGRIQFLAQMSHEFRTPLNTILGYAELLERNSKRISVQEGATSIKRSGRYLLGMIDEILDHARGEAGRLALTRVPVSWSDFIAALEHNTVLMMRPRGNTFKVMQEAGMPDAVMIDERRVRQVLDILLSNANRYTRHSTVTLTCASSSLNEHRRQLTFDVRDTGAGIMSDELERIFQPFIRGSAGQASGIDGTGMGLAIARQLVTLMDGTIGVENQPSGGSRFYFSIECELAEIHSQPVVKPGYGKLSQPYTVLVVDDDPNSCNLLSMLLSDCGFSVITAGTGNAARPFLNRKVDLVITDQLMPDGDGWSVLQDWDAIHVPVILLSSAPPHLPQDFPESVRFSHVKLKPFNVDSLLVSISEVLQIEWGAVKKDVPVPSGEVARPPMELLAPLKVMIEEGAVTDISEWLELFVKQFPEYEAYCAKIVASNLALDFDKLRNLIEAEQPNRGNLG